MRKVFHGATNVVKSPLCNNVANNTASTTSGTGGVNKDEQNVMNLTGHGKINLTFTTSAVVGEEDKKSKSMESTEVVRPDGDEKE